VFYLRDTGKAAVVTIMQTPKMGGTGVRQMILATVLLASLSKCSFAQENA